MWALISNCKSDVSITGTLIFWQCWNFNSKNPLSSKLQTCKYNEQKCSSRHTMGKSDILHFTSKDISLIIHRNSLLHYISPHQQDKKTQIGVTYVASFTVKKYREKCGYEKIN